MLVLARRLNEMILVPAIRTSIKVVALRPGLVRLGIEAPRTVKVLREEVVRRAGAVPAPPHPGEIAGALPYQAVRDGLDNMTVCLALIRGQLGGSGPDRLGALLDRVDEELQALQRYVEEAVAGGDQVVSAVAPAGPCPAGPG
jgi:carbon storage regulator CsrA